MKIVKAEVSWRSVGDFCTEIKLCTYETHCFEVGFSVRKNMEFSWIKVENRLIFSRDNLENYRGNIEKLYLLLYENKALKLFYCQLKSQTFKELICTASRSIIGQFKENISLSYKWNYLNSK